MIACLGLSDFFLFAACDTFYKEQNTDQKYYHERQKDIPLLDKSSQNIAYKRNGGYQKHVRKLCRYMIYMIALGACRGHDRGIRDG